MSLFAFCLHADLFDGRVLNDRDEEAGVSGPPPVWSAFELFAP